MSLLYTVHGLVTAQQMKGTETGRERGRSSVKHPHLAVIHAYCHAGMPSTSHDAHHDFTAAYGDGTRRMTTPWRTSPVAERIIIKPSLRELVPAGVIPNWNRLQSTVLPALHRQESILPAAPQGLEQIHCCRQAELARTDKGQEGIVAGALGIQHLQVAGTAGFVT